MKAAGILCVALLSLSALAYSEYEDEDPSLYEDESWTRVKRDITETDIEDEDEEEYFRPRRDADDSGSCCPYEYDEPLPRTRREVRRIRQYEVHEDTGDEPQFTAPLYGPEDLTVSATEQRARTLYPEDHYHRSLEPGAPAPSRYRAPVVAEDQETEGTVHHKHGHSAGGGHARQGKHYSEHDSHGVKGYKADEYLDKGVKGHKTNHLHKKQYEDAAGHKKHHHDDAGHEGYHEEEAQGHKGAKFDEKKGHKKGHKTKGYHNKYHKDEFHKEHKFYDDYHKGGSHHRYGKFHAKHASNEGGRKKAHHVDAAHDAVHKGTKGFSNKGHQDSDHRGHNSKQGHEQHHAHHESYGKKGGNAGGSKYGYKKN